MTVTTGEANGAGVRMFARQIGLGVVFWLAFLLVLEPGNLVRAAGTGLHYTFGQETLRLLSASLLGATTAPLQFWLVKRFPVGHRLAGRNFAIHSGACVLIAFGLLLIAYVIAPLVLSGSNPWLRISLGDQIASNELLLATALATFALVLHFVRRSPSAPVIRTATTGSSTILAQRQGASRLVPISDIDWIESQENYVALHVSAETYLVRDTLSGVLAKLDPQKFLRIHRRTVVNVACLRELKALGNGDALVRLQDDQELRASRTYAPALRELFRKG